MKAELKKLAVMLTIMSIFLSFAPTKMKIALSNGSGKIDLFTQNEPYSGKGPDVPSDAFGPGEVVILYALVTYGEVPVQNLIVTFYVQNPDESSFYLTTRTNASGIATINFTIPQAGLDESRVFGEWFVSANVMINAKIFQDSLTFEVNWIVKLISVRTIDGNLTSLTNFGTRGDVGLEITLRSIAMVTKSAMIAIVIKDELAVPVNSLEIYDFKVQSNEKLVFLYCKLYLPKWAHVGKATVFVSALTAPTNESGVAYCPSVSTEFFIQLYEPPLTITFHDVGIVEVTLSAESVEVGQPVNISALIQNEGTETEDFNVSAHYDGLLIGTLDVIALAPYSSITLNFTFNTSSVDPGNYTLTVSIPYMVNEADLTDNIFVDGAIEIKAKPPVVTWYLEVETEPAGIMTIPGEGWYKEYANVSLTAPHTILVSTGVRYKFTYWDIDGLSQVIGVSSIRVFMDKNHTASAHYVLQYYLIVKTDPVGIATILGEGWYNRSTYATLNAPAISGYNFEYWDLDGVPQGASVNPIAIHMNAPHTATAHYVSTIMYTLIIVTTEGGTTDPAPGNYTYAPGTTVQVTAIPNADYILDHWELDGVHVGSAIPYSVFMDNDHTLKAVFSPVPAAWFVPDWFYWLLLLLLVLVIALLIIWLYLRKRRKEAGEAFYSGWTAWYYCHNLRNKTYKI